MVLDDNPTYTQAYWKGVSGIGFVVFDLQP